MDYEKRLWLIFTVIEITEWKSNITNALPSNWVNFLKGFSNKDG